MTDTITQSIASVFRRPSDCNYSSMEELLKITEEEMEQSRIVKISGEKVEFVHNEEGFCINIPGQPALPLTNFSMTQVADMAKIPTKVLERLHILGKNDIVIDNLNALFPNLRSQTKSILVRDTYHDVGFTSVARAVNGDQYARLWDYEVFVEMEDFLLQQGFTPMLPELKENATRNGLMYNLDTGLFRGDECSFGFFFAEDDLKGDSSALGGLKPGMMVWNSEVGARSFGFHTFYYHEQSGSIIIWTPANHKRKRFVHRGKNIQKAFTEYIATLEDVAKNFQERFTTDLAQFTIAGSTPFATDGGAAIERLNKTFKMSAPNAKAAVTAAMLDENSFGDPLSIWNIALGIASEAGQTGRAESLVDNTMVATNMMRALLKV